MGEGCLAVVEMGVNREGNRLMELRCCIGLEKNIDVGVCIMDMTGKDG